MAHDAELDAMIFDGVHFQELARGLRQRVAGLTHLWSLGATEIGDDLCELAAHFSPRPLVPFRPDPEKIVRLGYSGGTTGTPKAIMFSTLCLMAKIDILLKEWEWPGEVRQLICSPLSHAGGVVFIPTLLKHGSIVVLPGFDATAVLKAIQEHQITSMLVVPAMIYALLDHPNLDDYDLSSLEVIYYGSSSISPSRLKEAIERFGPIFFQFYGQSEAPMSVAVMKRSEHDVSDLKRLAACGRPVPWVRVCLLDDDNRLVPDGEPGEICVQGPLLMNGYLNKPELTAEVFAGGWLHTGDIATRGSDGYLTIVDRKKDMIISGGFNVYPREVEDALSAHPSVAEAAVIGVPHEKWGEAVKAIVVLRDNAVASETELIAFVRARKGPVHAPKSIVFADRIPLSGVGKPDKKALRAQYATGGQRA
jgi:fatty-acyl-CoA synthase